MTGELEHWDWDTVTLGQGLLDWDTRTGTIDWDTGTWSLGLRLVLGLWDWDIMTGTVGLGH